MWRLLQPIYQFLLWGMCCWLRMPRKPRCRHPSRCSTKMREEIRQQYTIYVCQIEIRYYISNNHGNTKCNNIPTHQSQITYKKRLSKRVRTAETALVLPLTSFVGNVLLAQSAVRTKSFQMHQENAKKEQVAIRRIVTLHTKILYSASS